MAALALSSITIRDYPSGSNVLTLNVDPDTYSPFEAELRGSETRTLDGGVVRQALGVNQKDFKLRLEGRITHIETMKALWSRYVAGSGATQYELRDWYDNRFQVVFTPGAASFRPVPIPGSCEGFSYSLELSVCSILLWFGSTYP